MVNTSPIMIFFAFFSLSVLTFAVRLDRGSQDPTTSRIHKRAPKDTLPTNPTAKGNSSNNSSTQNSNSTRSTKTIQDKLPRLNGVNMAGLEFGIGIDGTASGNGNVPPPIDQVQHVLKQEGMNFIRIPFGWQYIQPKLNGPLDSSALAALDKYVNETLTFKGRAGIELHNYARLDGKIVGESDLKAEALIDLWTKLASHYKVKPDVIFGLMNEPHDVQSKLWSEVVQKLVTAIRKVGAPNVIIIPGNNWSHLSSFAADYAAGLSAVKNPDGSTRGLVFEFHQYFDDNGSGTGKGCSQDHLAELNSTIGLLKKDGRQGFVTEIGGDSSQSCTDIIKKFTTQVNAAFPTLIGVVMWSAGSFKNDIPLMIMHKEGSTWKDQPNFKAMKEAVKSFAT